MWETAVAFAIRGNGGSAGHGDLVRRSVEMGAVSAIAFTLVPFYPWYRGIARSLVARTSI